ncbi:BT4734/BF3469 family protein [Tenacibaculum sp. 47A_GOM-205m]|uniref:BT4734/BF3469 family protein n=1 Tax=Tenacibaculum sp. 47A_GOM-205m TaxID=1380384 RepID=UPI0004B9A91C|nr:BT4734/BF3469 family protein [Tenacibaculum sp. 47A_GOM-205m]
MNNKYYYFSTHTTNPLIYDRLEAYKTYKTLNEETKDLLDVFVDKYPKGEATESPIDYCSKFIMKHKEELYELDKLKAIKPKQFLYNFLGCSNQWNASTRSFGKNRKERANTISEQELIDEMTDPNESIKKLLDSSGGDLSAVKPFLPAIMISLDTNTRDKSKMEFKHTGKFCFDFDKLEDSNEAIKWMNKVWYGTKNIKPYMAFVSPRGKGFKIFCQVDLSNLDFQSDFSLEERESVMRHHKVWYEGARKELAAAFPELEDKIDVSTNDPQRLTYLPFIADKANSFKYDPSQISNYSEIVTIERELKQKELLKKISENIVEVKNIMKTHNITSKVDAYHLLIKNRSKNFNLEYETDKFIKVIDFLEDLSNEDHRVSNWVHEKFDDYHTLNKLCWVLYGVFGDLAIEQLKRLIPEGSNKLDEDHNDYRWAIKSKNSYTEEQLSSSSLGAFYELIRELGEVKDFLSEQYRLSSGEVNDFKLINNYYEIYIRNKVSYDEDNNSADLSEFLDEITNYIDKKKVRLPLIEELETITAEITLGEEEYLDKNVMHDLFQNKYAEKRIFCLRSQCGTGKNSIAGHPDYKMNGRTILSEPFMSIQNQIAKEAWDEENRPDQVFVNSNIENTLKSFKKKNTEVIKVNYESTLKGKDLPKSDDLVVHCTYNQVLNLSHEQLATFDYIFIDEAHTLSDGLDYRADVISNLIHHIIEFVSRNRDCKTKIIFMSGTPNVETHVIPELMERDHIKSLFQRIIVDKNYKRKPIIHLTNLDTDDSKERFDEVVNQMNKYLKQGRKVCHIFNNKAKMDECIREIQTKLSSDIKVGLFYSGSEGKCTQNILSGKFGDYDIVLATTFFINGININKDGVTEDEIKQGKISPQKYGVIIDLGVTHTKISAINAIQAINRFRNRQVHSTVFLPRIFKPDPKNSSREFSFRNAGKTILGINKYNYHLLSVNEGATPNKIVEEDEKEKLHLLEEVRKNPEQVTVKNISIFAQEEENKKLVIDSISKKARMYEDWFCSLDGYHYLAKDAGFNSIIKHKSIGEPLKEMTEDQIDLENELIRNFLNDERAMDYLESQVDPEKRMCVKASKKVSNPLSTDIGNFQVIDNINDCYIIQGDFHFSHERAVNKLIKYHLRLCYWYGVEEAIKILHFLINPEAELSNSDSPSYLKKITKYIDSCNSTQNDKLIRGINYIKTIDFLSDKKLGIVKKVEPTYISYTIHNIELVEALKNMWAKQQYEDTMYKLETSNSKEKKDLKKYYSNKELIKTIDLKELETQLNRLSKYTPLNYTKKGNLKSLETIIIPRVLRSKKLLVDMDLDISKFVEPELSTTTDNLNELTKICNNSLRNLKAYAKPLLKSNNIYIQDIFNSLEEKLKKKDIYGSIEYVNDLIENPTAPNFLGESNILNKLKIDLSKWDDLLLTSFKTSEHSTYNKLKNLKYVPFVRQTFFCDEEFKLESLDKKFTLDLNEEDVFKSLRKNSNQYSGTKKPRPRKNFSRVTINNNTTETSFVVLNKNGDIIYSDFSLTKACKFLCQHAYNNQGFVLKDRSTPPKNFNKGIYNPNTFKRDYYANSSKNKSIANYSIVLFDVNIQDYRDHLDKLKITPKKKRKKTA